MTNLIHQHLNDPATWQPCAPLSDTERQEADRTRIAFNALLLELETEADLAFLHKVAKEDPTP